MTKIVIYVPKVYDSGHFQPVLYSPQQSPFLKICDEVVIKYCFDSIHFGRYLGVPTSG